MNSFEQFPSNTFFNKSETESAEKIKDIEACFSKLFLGKESGQKLLNDIFNNQDAIKLLDNGNSEINLAKANAIVFERYKNNEYATAVTSGEFNPDNALEFLNKDVAMLIDCIAKQYTYFNNYNEMVKTQTDPEKQKKWQEKSDNFGKDLAYLITGCYKLNS